MEKLTEAYKYLGISREDYDTAFFEAGCYAAEQRYSADDAEKMKACKPYWNWLRTQQHIINTRFIAGQRPEAIRRCTKKQAFDVYYKMLCDHFASVYPPVRFNNAYCHGNKVQKDCNS